MADSLFIKFIGCCSQGCFVCSFLGSSNHQHVRLLIRAKVLAPSAHMFYHHSLKPERTPLEANVWGTPKSSGAFSTLFHSRLLRAMEYAQQPFELALSSDSSHNRRSVKVNGISEPLVGNTNCDSYEQFGKDSRLYVSCGDSAFTDLADGCVDLVVTDPPFFDNVHYSQLADSFMRGKS